MIYTGLTWDHPRGYNALAAAAARTAAAGEAVVNWSKQPLEGFESHPIADLAERFDILVLDHPHIGEAAAADCLLPLETVFDHSEIRAWREQTIGRAMASYEWQGIQYALPLDVATQVMAFRSDLVAEAPQTWDAVMQLAESIPVAMCVSGPHAICTFFAICVALGDEPGTAELVNDATATEALRILARLTNTAPRGTETANPIMLFDTMAGEDTIALVPLIFGYVNYARAAAGRRIVTFRDAPSERPAGRPGSVLGGTGIAITRQARPDARILGHLRWLMRTDTQSTFIPEHDGQPSARVAWMSDAVNTASGNFYRATLRSAESAWVRPRHDGYIAFQNEGSLIIRQAVLDGETHEVTIGKLRAAWSGSFARTRQRNK